MPRIVKERCTRKRVYVDVGPFPHPVHEALSLLGCHFDHELGLWWCARNLQRLAEINRILDEDRRRVPAGDAH